MLILVLISLAYSGHPGIFKSPSFIAAHEPDTKDSWGTFISEVNEIEVNWKEVRSELDDFGKDLKDLLQESTKELLYLSLGKEEGKRIFKSGCKIQVEPRLLHDVTRVCRGNANDFLVFALQELAVSLEECEGVSDKVRDHIKLTLGWAKLRGNSEESEAEEISEEETGTSTEENSPQGGELLIDSNEGEGSTPKENSSEEEPCEGHGHEVTEPSASLTPIEEMSFLQLSTNLLEEPAFPPTTAKEWEKALVHISEKLVKLCSKEDHMSSSLQEVRSKALNFLNPL